MNLTIPNLLTIARLGMVPLFIILVLQGKPIKALVVFAVAGLTDALDGFIARFWNQQSTLGAFLDPMADKLLLTSAFVILAIPGLFVGVPIPVWVTVLVITRDVVIVMVALVLYLAIGVSRFPPSPLSKVNTAVQLVTINLVLLSGTHPTAESAALVAIYLTAALTVVSGIDYIRLANRMAGAG